MSLTNGAGITLRGLGLRAGNVRRVGTSLLRRRAVTIGACDAFERAATPAASPFVLLAHVTVKPGLVAEYIKWGNDVDNIIEHTEPGMLYHSLDKHPTDDRKFTWTEVFLNDAALLAHFDNPPVIESLGSQAEYFYDTSEYSGNGGVQINIFGEVAEETKAECVTTQFHLVHRIESPWVNESHLARLSLLTSDGVRGQGRKARSRDHLPRERRSWVRDV